ncbi:MAG: efflux RND transporter periplasmic adaptor subunit [Rubrivivax sp.]
MAAPARLLRAAGLTPFLTLALALAWAPPAWAAKPVTSAPKQFGCLIEPDRVADIGSQVVGLVERMGVERGDSVSKGQALVTLRAEVERANAGVADTRARVDADVRAAQASLVLSEQKMARARTLLAENFVSEQAVEQAGAELELARQKLAQSRSQQRIWVEERHVAEAQLALRTVRSPFDGVVVERFVNLGERVEEKPLLRLAVIDPLRVELMVPTAQYGAIRVGDELTIRPELPGVEPVSATVRHVDRVLDAASNSFRVRLSLPNPSNRLPAGLRCKADLPVAAAAPASAPRFVPTSTSPQAVNRPPARQMF